MGGKQLGFSDDKLTSEKKLTKREKFLSETEAVVLWYVVIDLIKPHCLCFLTRSFSDPEPQGCLKV